MTRRGRPPVKDVLTPAEWKVADAIRHGGSNPQVAKRLGITVDAVKYHVANILQKLAFTSRQQLRVWPGVRQSSALYQEDQLTKAQSLRLGPVGQISRTVQDIAAAEVWYRDVLGLEHLYTFGELCFFDCDGMRLFLCQSPDKSRNVNESIIYFRTPNIRAAHQELLGRGIEFLNAPHMVHRHADGSEEWMAFFKDNEERPLAIMATVLPQTT